METSCIKILFLCSLGKITAYRFTATWGWVNNDGMFIFMWTMALKLNYHVHSFLKIAQAAQSELLGSDHSKEDILRIVGSSWP